MEKLSQILFLDLLKNPVVIGSYLLFSLIGWGVFLIEGTPEKAILLILQITLLVIPVITLIFSSVYYYNSSDYVILLLSQPIKRSSVIRGFYKAIIAVFILIFFLGIGCPLLVFYPSKVSAILLVSGVLLIGIFVAISLWIGTRNVDKVKGIGLALILWVFFAFLYDGILLFIMFQFSNYPIEKMILVLSFLNPLDIARITIIMQTDASALLGLTGAIFKDFFGSQIGQIVALSMMAFWGIFAYFMTQRNFNKMDL